ncbi:DUF2177 family protein [Candidatus Woesebacteria bacterium]|jgi:uncharacterized membrane protein|nr:DUF2177 family protein [Candidatus Woesebacteria bacterium]MBP9687341.1 DUF2177 family protein [Candidatus Woesebacteria bacterium]
MYSPSVFVATAIVTTVIDLFWLNFVANKLYLDELGKLLRKNASGGMAPLVFPALLIYIVIPLAIFLFAIPKGWGKSPAEAFFWGAMLGLAMYAVYDLTNLATLNNWSAKITVIDIIWGMVLCGSVTAIVTRIFS